MLWSKTDEVHVILDYRVPSKEEQRKNLRKNLKAIVEDLKVDKEHSRLRRTIKTDPNHKVNLTETNLIPNKPKSIHSNETLHDRPKLRQPRVTQKHL